MNTKAKRLAPTSETLRQLFLKSGNLCSFPGCNQLMMNMDGTFIGQVCHIEAAEVGGERFNDAMSNEERRAPENLMLMCYEHHIVTNDVARFPVQVLRGIKADHERRFSSPDRAMLATLRDWTRAEAPKPPINLLKANRVLEWNNDAAELLETAERLGRYIEELSRVPIEVRSFVGKVAERSTRLGKSSATARSHRGILVACYDIETAFRLSAEALGREAVQLELHHLGGPDQLDVGEREVPAIWLRAFDGWSIWADLAQFCASETLPMEGFTELLDFSALDE